MASTINPTIRIRTKSDEYFARIEIEDNGPGIPEEVRKRIFDPFFTTKPVGEGTGLGLSVSFFIIVSHHHGTIEAESSPGEGTRFIIRLPLAPPSSTVADRPTEQECQQ
jgi:signal transduction histidine kinase